MISDPWKHLHVLTWEYIPGPSLICDSQATEDDVTNKYHEEEEFVDKGQFSWWEGHIWHDATCIWWHKLSKKKISEFEKIQTSKQEWTGQVIWLAPACPKLQCLKTSIQ